VRLALEGEHGLLAGDGSALMVHAGADDYRSQPSGAAGERIACGVVERSPADDAEGGS
jgi:Cu-Zn family superoxide dismutase